MTAHGKSQGMLFVVSAPSGAGKTSLIKELLAAASGLGVAVSHTTRARREGEADGVNYHFVSEVGFQEVADRGGFLEWACVYGHLYGTSVAAADLVLGAGKHLILEIDWQGAAPVRSRFPDARSIFIFPPSLQSLKDRLERRGQDDPATVARRMNAALEEISHWKEFDYLLVNDDFDTALAELTAVVQGDGEPFLREARALSLEPLIRELSSQEPL